MLRKIDNQMLRAIASCRLLNSPFFITCLKLYSKHNQSLLESFVYHYTPKICVTQRVVVLKRDQYNITSQNKKSIIDTNLISYHQLQN